MRKGFQLTALSGALALVMMGNVNAADTTGADFDWLGWSVQNGIIDESGAAMCSGGTYSCSEIASGLGFKQLSVSDTRDTGTGTTYIFTIVTDQDAGTGNTPVFAGSPALGFFDTSLVRMDLTLGGGAANNVNSQSGIVGRQEISSDAGAFTSTSSIATGWAQTAGEANIVITQSLNDPGVDPNFAGDEFSSDFLYRANTGLGGTPTGFEMSIDQIANLGTSGIASSALDTQAFALRQKQGDMLLADSTTPADANNDGSGVTWTANVDEIKAIWIGQEIELGNGANNTGLLGSSFGYLAFENIDGTPAQPIDSGFGFSVNESGGAWVWDPAFNVAGSTGLVDPITGAPVLR